MQLLALVLVPTLLIVATGLHAGTPIGRHDEHKGADTKGLASTPNREAAARFTSLRATEGATALGPMEGMLVFPASDEFLIQVCPLRVCSRTRE